LSIKKGHKIKLKKQNKIKDFLGFDTRKPSVLIVVTLLLILALIVFLMYHKKHFSEFGDLKNIDGIFYLMISFFLLTTPLVDWMRNLTIFVSSLFFSGLMFYNKYEMDWFMAILPFYVLIYSLISRLIFRWIMGFHPITLLYKGHIERKSFFENRNSNKTDFIYSKMYLIVGFLLMCVLGMIHLKK
jgi:hypothetical protein